MNASSWTFYLVPIAAAVGFGVCRRAFPMASAGELEVPLTDTERRMYRRWAVGSIAPLFILWPVFGFVWFLVLTYSADMFDPATPGMRFLVRPLRMLWGLPAMFLGILSSGIALDWLYHRLLGDRYVRYDRFCIERSGYDGRPVLWWLGALGGGGTALCFALAVNSFARFDNDGITIARPLAMHSAFYPYRHVRSIEHRATVVAPNGNTIERPHYVLEFDDGSTWTTKGGFRDPVPETDAAIIRWVSLRSGRKVVERP